MLYLAIERMICVELSYELLHNAYTQAENMMDVEGRAACIVSMLKRLQITENTYEREQLEQFLQTHFKVVILAAMEKIYAHDGKIAEYYLTLLPEKNYQPMYESYYYLLGRAYYEQGDWCRAVQYFAKHLQEYYDDELAHFFWGNSCYKLGQYMQAVMEYQKAADINNSFQEATENISCTLEKMNNIKLGADFNSKTMNWNIKHNDILLMEKWEDSSFDIPIFINSRDRVTVLEKQINWLLTAGYRNIHILDNQSSYPALLAYYDKIKEQGVKIWYLPYNFGFKAIWKSNILNILQINTPYVYTDSDVLPDENCPYNVVEEMLAVLSRHRYVKKIGLTLHVDDITYYNRDEVIDSHFKMKQVKIADGYFQQTDTTFALYRNLRHYSLRESLRTNDKFMGRHIPWYYDYDNLPADELYYMEHANYSSTQACLWKQSREQ